MQDVARKVPWAFLSYAVPKGLSLLTTVVLARLLVPADFGIVALATLVIHAMWMFRDLGLGATFIVRQDLDDRGAGTVLTLMLVAGAAVAGVIAALAPAAAAIFDEPRLTSVLLVLSATALIAGPSFFYGSLLQRELEFRRRFLADLAQSATSAVVAISAAALGAGLWSLVAGQVAATATFTAALVAVAPRRIAPAWDRREARRLLGTGQRFVAQGGFATVQQNADYFAIGVTLPAAPLGWYSMSYRLAEVPYLAVADPVAAVTFPAFARRREKGLDVTADYLAALQFVALITVPAGVVLSAAADPFTRALLGDPWLPMVGALTVLGLLGALRAVHVTVGWLLNSVGAAGAMAAVSALTVVPLVPALLVAASESGITAVAWVMLADVLLAVVALAVLARRRAGVAIGRHWAALRPVVAGGAAAWVAGRAVAEATAGAPAGVGLALSASAALAVFAAAVALLERDALRRVGAHLRAMTQRGEPGGVGGG